MKLVIEIDEGTYESAKEMSETSIDEYKAMRAIANGTPLDSVLYDIKAEIEDAKIDVDIDFGNETLYNNAIDDVLEIIDKKVKEYRNG